MQIHALINKNLPNYVENLLVSYLGPNVLGTTSK